MKMSSSSCRFYGVAFCVLFVLTSAWTPISTYGAEKPETPHLSFVAEWIRQLAAIERIRLSWKQELQLSTREDSLANTVYASTLMQLELRTQIRSLDSMRLNPPFQELIPNLKGYYEGKIRLLQQVIDITGVFIAGPSPDVDYGKLAAELPKIRAQLDFLDHSLFKATPLIFYTLVNPKANSKNQVNHLIITKGERAQLISDLTISFGPRLDMEGQNYTVSAASILKASLLKNYKCSDESWE